jgi:hypothetical protein
VVAGLGVFSALPIFLVGGGMNVDEGSTGSIMPWTAAATGTRRTP